MAGKNHPESDHRDRRHVALTCAHLLPQLDRALNLLVDADRLLALALDELIDLDEEQVHAITGVSLNQWLSLIARRTSTDARMLRTAATVCARMPSLRTGFSAGKLSWAQVRAVALMCHRLPRHLDDMIDAAIAPIICDAEIFEPNAVTSAVRQALASIEPATVSTPVPEPREFLAMQPRADGHGGQLFGEMGPAAWAIVDAALNTPTANATAASSTALPAHATTDTTSIDNRPDAGRHRLGRLIGLLDEHLAGSASDNPAATCSTNGAQRSSLRGMRSRPQLLLRAELESLLNRSQMPGTLLTRLFGGRAWLDAPTTRRLINERGADLRTVIVDTGRIVGVGRRTRVPPHWLEDALFAIHDTCMAPGCDRAARSADIDHAAPWHPQSPGVVDDASRQAPSKPGRTDIDQLAPVCAHHNRRKEADGWHVAQHADHTRTWTHSSTGLSTTTVPDTWQPPSATPCNPPDPTHNRPDSSRDRPDIPRDPPSIAHEPRGRYDVSISGGVADSGRPGSRSEVVAWAWHRRHRWRSRHQLNVSSMVRERPPRPAMAISSSGSTGNPGAAMAHHNTGQQSDADTATELSDRVQELERHLGIVERQLDSALAFQDELRTALTIVCGALDVVTESDGDTH